MVRLRFRNYLVDFVTYDYLAQKDGTELEAYCFIKCSKSKMNIFVGKYTKYNFHEGTYPRRKLWSTKLKHFSY